MKIESLEVGMRIKNYKKLCEVLEIKVTSSNGKKAQLKELERFIKYSKDKNTFIIEEIFETPIPKSDEGYATHIRKLIIHELSSRPLNDDGYTINMSRNGLYLKLHMINSNYNIARNQINKFSRYVEIPINTIHDFFNNTSGKLSDNVERCLNKLQSECLLRWEYRLAVKTMNNTNRIATTVEINAITEIEQEILRQMDEPSKREIFQKGKWNEFNKKVTDMLKETINIQYYYKTFHINTTKSFRKILMNEFDVMEEQGELSAKLINSCVETAKKRKEKISKKYEGRLFIGGKYHIKPEYDNHKNILRSQYIEDTKRIANLLIETDVLEIDLSKVKGDKYTLIDAIYDEGGDWGVEYLDDIFAKIDDLL